MKRAGFTLIELLVVVIIMLILTVMTVTAINSTIAGDRTRAAARQIQSYLEGARDRAIYAGEPRGVRFLVDDIDPNTVSSMVFIGAPEHHSLGEISIRRRWDHDNQTVIDPDPDELHGFGTGWGRLFRQGLLVHGARIQLGKSWYTVNLADDRSDPANDILVITPHYRGSTFSPSTSRRAASIPRSSDPENRPEYRLELAPAVLPNQEPMLLPRGVVIDLDNSRLPSSWGSWSLNTATPYSRRMDVMFSPRGTVTGPTAAAGVIHFLLRDLVDVEKNRGIHRIDNPADYLWPGDQRQDERRLEGEEIIVTLFTHTGHISTHRVDPTGASADGSSRAGDPFRFAETGDTAK